MQANLYRNFEFTFLFVKIISLSSSNFDRPIQKKKKKSNFDRFNKQRSKDIYSKVYLI